MHTLIQLSCFYNNDTVIVAYDNIVTDGNSLCDKSRAESDGGGRKMCSSKCLYSSSCLPSFCSQAGSGHIQGQPFRPHCKSLSVLVLPPLIYIPKLLYTVQLCSYPRVF